MAQNCNFGISKAILNDCEQRPTAGAEPVAYAMNREDVVGGSVTYDGSNNHLVTALTLAGTAKAYKVEGFKKRLTLGLILL